MRYLSSIFFMLGIGLLTYNYNIANAQEIPDLFDYHPGCDNASKSRDGACIAAMHRACVQTGHGGAGISQEVVGPSCRGANMVDGVFGVACFNPQSYVDVPLDTLKNFHPGCDNLSKSQDGACMAAIHRWCAQTGRGGAGIAQEVNANGVFGVACFNPQSYVDVPLDTLKNFHPGCDNLSKSQDGACVAAIHRWCAQTGRGDAGIAQEVNVNGVFGVACFKSSWYGDMVVRTGTTCLR